MTMVRWLSHLKSRTTTGLEIVLLAYAGLLQASPNNAVNEGGYFEEVPVVLSVSRLSTPVNEAPAAVTVIDRQMIRDSGAWDLAEVFRLVPGMVVSYHAARSYSMDNTVSYHGLSDPYARSMQMLVDGRSVYSPLFGGVLWGDIPLALDDIERIEVIRGPNSASYGANSFMGVINIISRHSAESQGKFLSLTAARSRSEGLMRYGGREGDLTYRITAGMRNDRGEDTLITNPLSSQGGWDKNKYDDRKVKLFNLRADYRLSTTDELELQFGYNGGDRQEGDAGNPEDIYPFWKRADHHFEQLRWRRSLAAGSELLVQYYHYYESSYGTQVTNAGSTLVDVIAQRHDLEVQHSFAPSDHTRLVWGGSVRYDKVYAPAYHDPDGIGLVDKNQTQGYRLARLFGNLEWHLRPDLVFNAGAMIEENSYTGTDITPRVAANWHFLPGHTLRLSNSRATRTPTDYEKVRAEPFIQLGMVNQRLRPERVNSTDIGYLGKFPGVDVDFRLFRDEFTDLIVENGTSLALGNFNPGRATVRGFETQLQWRISDRTKLIYNLSHGIVSSLNQAFSYTNSVPTNNQSLMLTHRFSNRWSASLMGYQMGEAHFQETDSGPNSNRRYFVDTYRRFDVRLSYHFQSGSQKGELALMVQNLTDADYFEFRHDNQPPGRSAWLNLKLEF